MYSGALHQGIVTMPRHPEGASTAVSLPSTVSTQQKFIEGIIDRGTMLDPYTYEDMLCATHSPDMAAEVDNMHECTCSINYV